MVIFINCFHTCEIAVSTPDINEIVHSGTRKRYPSDLSESPVPKQRSVTYGFLEGTLF